MKLVLDNESLTCDFFADTRLLGIMAPVKNYFFCWQLKALGYDFRLNSDIDRQLRRKNRMYYFSVYRHQENNFLDFYLYHNHCDGEFLLPEVRHIDFLLLMKGDIVDDEKCSDIVASLRSINCVQMVVEITEEMLRNKEHLVF